MKLIAKNELMTIRVKKGLSLTQLAKLMEVNVSVVFKMERQQPIRPATAQKACKALGEPFDNLFVIEN